MANSVFAPHFSLSAINSATAVTRATSTVTTGGIGNHLVSTSETATASFVSVLAIFLPIVAFIVVILIIFVGIRLFKRFFISKK